MAKKAKAPPPESAGEARSPFKAFRIRRRLAERLEDLAKRNESNPTDEANHAVRERLEKFGMWPPADGSD